MTNSTCERMNGVIAQTLRAYVDKNQSNWHTYIPNVMMAIRATPNESTQMSPYEMMFGQPMPLPVDLRMLPKTTMQRDAQEYFRTLLDRLKDIHQLAEQNKAIAQAKMKERFDQKAKEPHFQIGQKVMKQTKQIPVGLSPKLYMKWEGPYEVIELGPNHLSHKSCRKFCKNKLCHDRHHTTWKLTLLIHARTFYNTIGAYDKSR